MKGSLIKNPFNLIVIVAALGYFVDIYDLILFSIVRIPSLLAIGVPEADLLNVGVELINAQMAGMLIGGIVWGILGDRTGRLSVLFLTIIIYSLANFANGFVQSVEQYRILRFIAGFGLAGELGIGITLVSEVMTQETRGHGTTLVASVGLAGALLGFLVNYLFDWRTAYIVGGVLGMVLLFMRLSVYESVMFAKTHSTDVKKGDFFSLFTNRKRFLKYLYCILLGVPVWYVIGILVTFSPEFAKALHIQGDITGGHAVMIHYTGVSIGSFILGMISQKLRSRRKALLIALVSLSVFIALYFSTYDWTAPFFYFILFLLGMGQGYWAVFITVAAEQFGTNLRATVTTSVPNFVRGAIVPMTLGFKVLTDHFGIATGGIAIGIAMMALAFFAWYHIEETYHKDLDFHELI